MKEFSLAKKAFFKAFDRRLFKALLPTYIVIIILRFFFASQYWPELIKTQQDLSNLSTANSVTLLLLRSLGGLIFIVLLYTALDAIEKNNIFKIPEIEDLAIKTLKVIMVSIISSIFIILGLIFFIIPGIFLSKRYIYVLIIAVEGRVGIFESMKLSKELSKKNGWSTYLSLIIIYISIYGISMLAVNPLFIYSSEAFYSYFLYGTITAYLFYVPFHSALYYGYNEAKKLVLKE